jgi:ABC-type branched-subunit amino acid transport system ATPase component
MSPALELGDIAVRFGGIQALDGVKISIAAGEFVGLIGPNGAGKTTLIRIVAGKVRPDRGRVVIAGSDVTGTSTAFRVRRGLTLTHQIVRPFREMTVLDNVCWPQVIAARQIRCAPYLTSIGAAKAKEPPPSLPPWVSAARNASSPARCRSAK